MNDRLIDIMVIEIEKCIIFIGLIKSSEYVVMMEKSLQMW